jgi:hypothetical protein
MIKYNVNIDGVCFAIFLYMLQMAAWRIHCKKRFVIFPSKAGMSLIKLSLDGNNLIIPVQGEFGQ